MPHPNPDHAEADADRCLRVGSLFSGYGGLDLAVEHVFGARTVWFSEINSHVARIFAHHWPHAPNLGDITGIDLNTVEPIDILCGGFPCQDVSVAGRRAGMAPGTRSGLWSHMAAAVEALQPTWVVIENVRGLLSSPAVRAPMEGDDAHDNTNDDRRCNPGDATPEPATLRGLELDPWGLGDQPARPVRAAGAVLGDLADLRYDAEWVGLPASAVGAPHPRFRVFILAHSTTADPGRLRLPARQRDPATGQVKARRGTVWLTHQLVDLVLSGPPGPGRPVAEPDTLWSLIDDIFNDGESTDPPSPDGSTSPDDQPQHQPS